MTYIDENGNQFKKLMNCRRQLIILPINSPK